MQTLRVDVSGRALSFAPDKPIRIGRSIDADVVVSSTAVSRAHAELRPTPSGWTLVDVGSSGGTYVDGRPVREIPLTGRTQVQLGPVGEGAVITVTPEEHVAADAPPAQAPAPPPPPGHTAIQAPGTPTPGGAPAPGAPAWQAMPPPGGAPSDGVPDASEMTIAPGMARPGLQGFPGAPAQPSTGPDLLLVAEGKEHRFRHPATVTVGRAEENDVVIADQGVSRHHGRLVPKPDGWVFQNASQTGTFLKGKPVTSQEIEEETELRLGHPVAGEILKVIPVYSAEVEIARAARKRRNKGLMWGAIAAAIVLVVGGLMFGILKSGGDDNAPAADGLPTATLQKDESAIVWLFYFPDQDHIAMGSGSIVDPHGVILTNAHVADPSKIPDMGEASPPFVYVSLTDPKNGYSVGKPEYRAKVVKSDGDVDSAAIQIYADADGKPIDPSSLNLPAMKIADSDKVQEGDDVTVLGFPGIVKDDFADGNIDAYFQPPSVTKGTIATILNVNGEARARFDITARVAHGNSGGAMVNDQGELIGVPTWAINDTQTGDQSFQGTPIKRHEVTLSAAGVKVP